MDMILMIHVLYVHKMDMMQKHSIQEEECLLRKIMEGYGQDIKIQFLAKK